MPCRDGGPDEPGYSMVLPTLTRDLEATMCAVFTVLERENALSDVLDRVDWKEAGISRRDVATLWQRHKAEDHARRERERKERERADLRAFALSKLTDEERIALGV